MRYDYIFFRTDSSFDYGQGTCYDYEEHGFSIDIDKFDNVDINSLKPFGCFCEMKEKCKTLSQLKQYILDNFNEIEDDNEEVFEELISFIDDNLKQVA